MAITTIRQLTETIQQHGVVFVRHSRRPAADLARGYSLDWSSRSREAGLSCVELSTADVERGTKWIVKLVADYAYCGPVSWLLTGEVVGEGADGEPVVAQATKIATISRVLVDRCREYLTAEHQRSRSDKGVNDLRPWPTLAEFGL